MGSQARELAQIQQLSASSAILVSSRCLAGSLGEDESRKPEHRMAMVRGTCTCPGARGMLLLSSLL